MFAHDLYQEKVKRTTRQYHSLSVSTKYLLEISSGDKIYEGRMFHPDKDYQIGDVIIMKESRDRKIVENGLFIIVEIIDLLWYPSFEVALVSLNKDQILPGIKSVEEGKQIYQQFVSLPTQEKVGICMIQIKNITHNLIGHFL